MGLKIVSLDGKSAQQAASDRLHAILSKLNNSGKLMQNAMVWTVRNHFRTIYPDSQHYSPDKVTDGAATNGSTPTAEAIIDVPGVTRAYHDITILPKVRRALTIPCHRSAYGKSARDFDHTFIVHKKDGHAFIAQNKGGALVALFNLVQRAFQRQDTRLMPSDQTLADNVFARLKAYLGT